MSALTERLLDIRIADRIVEGGATIRAWKDDWSKGEHMCMEWYGYPPYRLMVF